MDEPGKEQKAPGTPGKTQGRARARKSRKVRLPVDTTRSCRKIARSTGQPCKAHPVVGFDVCQSHGGGGGGPAGTGRWSSAPARLQAAYEAALADPKLLDLRRGLAMMDAILLGLQARLGAGDTPAWRQELRAKWSACRSGKEGAPSIEEVGELIEKGADEDRATLGLFECLERFQKRIEEGRRVKLAAAQVVNARDLNTALVRLLDELQRGAAAEGVAEEVVERLLGRMEGAVRDLGLDPSDRGVGVDATRN